MKVWITQRINTSSDAKKYLINIQICITNVGKDMYSENNRKNLAHNIIWHDLKKKRLFNRRPENRIGD